MNIFIFLLSVLLLMFGHTQKLLRWRSFICLYETPSIRSLLRAMSIGYAVNQILPFKAGDLFRAISAGKHIKNGTGLSLATVIIDRFLDIVSISLIFLVLYCIGANNQVLLDSARFYSIIMAVLLLGYVILRCFTSSIKYITMKVCSIFNDRLKLNCEKFFWALINAFRNLKQLKLSLVLLQTVLMWSSYLASYALLGLYMHNTGSKLGLTDIMITLFSRASLNLSTVNAVFRDTGVLHEQLVILIYNLLPPLLLYVAASIPCLLKVFSAIDEKDRHFQSILPQLEEKDQLSFLDDYFSAKKPELIKKFIAINQHVSIIADHSSGSNAYTILCMDRSEQGQMFFRKYAFGSDGDKLYEQQQWLEKHSQDLPICSILRFEHNDSYCYYDMPYIYEAAGMFTYIHSHPVFLSWRILSNVLDTLDRQLYHPSSFDMDKALVEQYIGKKVLKNLELIMDSRELHELISYDTLVINHHEYRNLPLLKALFDKKHLIDVFSEDICAEIHGDLTIENIICVSGAEPAFYLIDPNTGNIHDSPFLDYAKLLQSLHGGYEFMIKTGAVTVDTNRIDFIYTRSAVYNELFTRLRHYLDEHYSRAQVRSVFFHELVHWLRLLPYKLRKDPQRAPIFYAGFIIVANDVYEWFEKE